MVACAGRIFMPLMSPGTVIFLVLEWNVPGSCTKARQNLTSFISLSAYLRYQASSACEPALRVGDQERQFAGADDREAARLVAGIDVGEVGDAVARHVVMVEGLAELLRRIDLVLDGAAGGLLDRGAPFLERLLQRMRRRHPVRQLELEGLVLGEAGGGRAATGRRQRARKRERRYGLSSDVSPSSCAIGCKPTFLIIQPHVVAACKGKYMV